MHITLYDYPDTCDDIFHEIYEKQSSVIPDEKKISVLGLEND